MRLWLKMKIISEFGSQRNFARIIGKSDDYVSKLVQGVKKPSNPDKTLICQALGEDYNEELFIETRGR